MFKEKRRNIAQTIIAPTAPLGESPNVSLGPTSQSTGGEKLVRVPLEQALGAIGTQTNEEFIKDVQKMEFIVSTFSSSNTYS